MYTYDDIDLSTQDLFIKSMMKLNLKPSIRKIANETVTSTFVVSATSVLVKTERNNPTQVTHKTFKIYWDSLYLHLKQHYKCEEEGKHKFSKDLGMVISTIASLYGTIVYCNIDKK